MPAEDWTIVLFATRGLAAFVENALLGIERCGIAPDLVQVLFPANAEREIGALAKRFGTRPRILEGVVGPGFGAMPDSYLDYGTPDFNRLMRVRFPMIREILGEGRRIVYADVDVAWLRNPLTYLSSVLSHYPWTCQTEAYATFPPVFCTGFFALRDDPICRELIEAHIRLFNAGEPGPSPTLQRCFNRIVHENPRYLASIFPLPEGHFPSGLLYPIVQQADAPQPMTGQLAPFIFHGNWTVGLPSKCRLLKQAGAWLI